MLRSAHCLAAPWQQAVQRRYRQDLAARPTLGRAILQISSCPSAGNPAFAAGASAVGIWLRSENRRLTLSPVPARRYPNDMSLRTRLMVSQLSDSRRSDLRVRTASFIGTSSREEAGRPEVEPADPKGRRASANWNSESSRRLTAPGRSRLRRPLSGEKCRHGLYAIAALVGPANLMISKRANPASPHHARKSAPV